MQSAADGALRPVSTQPVHSYEIGLSLRPKRGERVSGDSAAHFETEDGTLCLLLSDGMGCGEAAQRESSMAARLLERFLSAGIDAPRALSSRRVDRQLYDSRPADAFAPDARGRALQVRRGAELSKARRHGAPRDLLVPARGLAGGLAPAGGDAYQALAGVLSRDALRRRGRLA